MTNRYQYGLPIPYQGVNRQAHPDGYTGFPGAVNQQPVNYAYGHNTYGGGMVAHQQAYRGYQANHQFAQQGFSAAPRGYYGNPTVIRVSDANWVNALLEAMRQGQEIDLVFDAVNIVEQLVQAVQAEVGSFADIVRRRVEGALDEVFSTGMAYPNPNVPAQAMVAPLVVAAIIAAIVVVALAIIYAVVAIYNANASREIAEISVNRGCSVIDIETTSTGSGSGEGWFDFLNGSTWKIRCPGQ